MLLRKMELLHYVWQREEIKKRERGEREKYLRNRVDLRGCWV